MSDVIIGSYWQRYEIISNIMKELDKHLNDYDNLSDDLEIGFEVKLTIKE
jgi:hypothetical protein